MERRINSALRGCATALDGLAVECVLASCQEGCACLVKGRGGQAYVLKVAWGQRAPMLRGEWAALGQLASQAPGCAPWPVAAGEMEDGCYLLREYVPGQTLVEWVEARGSIPLAEAQRAARDLAALIGAIHRAGLVCRDIKPENLVRTGAGRFVLIDGGTVRRPAPDKDRDTVLYATRGFAAPEQFGFRQSDARADIYALGATLCFLFTGTADEKALKGRGIPRRVRRVVQRAMAFAPEARYQNMDQVVSALARPPRRAALLASLLALALCGAVACALLTRVPAATDFATLTAALDRIPPGGSGAVRVQGTIRCPEKVRVWQKRVTFMGEGVITNESAQMETMRVYDGSEIVLTERVTIENTGEEFPLVLQGGRLVMEGGAIRKTGQGKEAEGTCALLLTDGASAQMLDGNIFVRQDSGDSIAVNLAGESSFALRGGRIDAMADSVSAVLVGDQARFVMEGGMINAVARQVGYVVHGDMDYLGGEMLLNGLMSVPLQLSTTTVTSYDQLVEAISARATDGRLVLAGAIQVPRTIRINGGREIFIKGGEGALMNATGEGLFMVDEDSSLHLEDLALDGRPAIVNAGTFRMQGVTVRCAGDRFIDNSGTAHLLFSNAVAMDSGYVLRNGAGGNAIVTANATTGGTVAYINQGHLTLRQGSVDLTGDGARAVEEQGGQVEVDRTVFMRQGAVQDAG